MDGNKYKFLLQLPALSSLKFILHSHCPPTIAEHTALASAQVPWVLVVRVVQLPPTLPAAAVFTQTHTHARTHTQAGRQARTHTRRHARTHTHVHT